MWRIAELILFYASPFSGAKHGLVRNRIIKGIAWITNALTVSHHRIEGRKEGII